MNIEFIKWLCEKAEGFKYKGVSKYGDLVKVVKLGADGLWFDPVEVGSWNYKYLFYPLLLQRAIEGVNRASDLISIGQYALDIAVSSSDTLYREYFLIEEYETIDQAKEAALQWVWENEK